MCGRFAFALDSFEGLKKKFSLTFSPVLKNRYNLSPGEYVPVVREPGKLELLHWGLIPKWLEKNNTLGFFNSKIETITEKPAFKYAIKKQRCLILATGFYEWKTVKKSKQPFYCRLKNSEVFCFAGIWDNEGVSILTKLAPDNFQELHDRVPCIIAEQNIDAWLNPKTNLIDILLKTEKNQLDNFIFFPVSTVVNFAKNDGASCVLPL